jgi:hypothetical protein
MFAGGLIVSKRTNASMMPDHTKEDITFEPFARPTWWQRIRHKFTNKPVKYLTGSGKAPTDSRDALPQSDGDAFRAPDAGTGLILLPLVSPRPHYQQIADAEFEARIAHEAATSEVRKNFDLRTAAQFDLETWS